MTAETLAPSLDDIAAIDDRLTLQRHIAVVRAYAAREHVGTAALCYEADRAERDGESLRARALRHVAHAACTEPVATHHVVDGRHVAGLEPCGHRYRQGDGTCERARNHRTEIVARLLPAKLRDAYGALIDAALLLDQTDPDQAEQLRELAALVPRA
jgi:hypothetical protein